MPYRLNEKIQNLEPYEPIKGFYRIRMDANESYMDLPLSTHVNVVEKLLNIRFNRYPDPLATEVRELFAAFHGLSAEQLTASNGLDEMLFVLISAFLMKGEKLLVTAPDFTMYKFYGSLTEAQVLEFNKGEDLELDTAALIEYAQQEKPRMLIFSNPCNPTGRGLRRDEVRGIITALPETLIVLDEAYMDFWDESLILETDLYDNLIVLRTFSKAFQMAGVRLGIAVANATLTKAIRAVKSPYNVGSLAQATAVAVLSHPELIKDAIAKAVSSRDYLYENTSRLAEQFTDLIQLNKTYANFVFIKSDYSRRIFEELAEKSIIVRIMGSYLRVTAGSPTENIEFLQVFEQILKEIQDENSRA
ncbi:MAG: aminotransferase class I/II-fold pyridoxal phosphate-dependent enzyme [Oscillospiraceae bacterium]|jgi:histidinol-phosphate aminotransferase|nr:aminotransferase class I/II-fold pyridoxal phosphate-dependent enzyme [Oscillospiraceae bacterium]